MNDNIGLLKKYFSNINISLIVAAFTCCDETWRDIDYIPDYNKFYYIIEGEGWLRIDGKDYYPGQGQLFMMPSGVKQSFSYINENRFKKYWCHFTAKSGEFDVFSLISEPLFVNVDVQDQPLLAEMFDRLILASKKNTLASEIESKARLMDIITWYMNACESREGITIRRSDTFNKLELAHTYIRNHLAENLTVEKLAGIAHYHPNYFIRIFKQHMGVTPIQYINNIRLKKAKELLIAGNMPVSAVAKDTGFSDVSHFSRSFKQHTGFSPTEFRKSIEVKISSLI